MKSLKLADISSITEGILVKKSSDSSFNHVDFDTRRIVDGKRSLFIALSGGSHDGHDFVQEAYRLGVRNFMVSDAEKVNLPEDVNLLLVESGLDALQKFAAYYRQNMPLEVIGITGSNGKTIVKEWLNQLLAEDKRIVRNPRSYNSQLGVPLSLLNIEEFHKLGLFEAGISKPGEMVRHAFMIKPDIGIFINLGTAHLENFKDQSELALEKMHLFANTPVLLLSADYTEIKESNAKLRQRYDQQTITWSMRGNEADLLLKERIPSTEGNRLVLEYRGNSFDCLIPFTDDASTENALACILTMLQFGYDFNTIRERGPRLSSVAMRMEVLSGINDSKLINDSYNSDIYSLNIALDVLDQQSKGREKTLIISDMAQTGLEEEALYREIADTVGRHGVSKILAIGPIIGRHLGKFNIPTDSFPDTEAFLSRFNPEDLTDRAVLIKGARSFEFERIVKRFMEKAHDTILEIDLGKMAHNLGVYRSKLSSKTRVMAVVKAFSYGSGSEEIARFLEFHKVDYLAVAYTDEGVRLREAGISTPIMVMNPERSSLEAMIRYRLEPEISRKDQLDAIKLELEKRKDIVSYPIHIKVDTGMNRLGFETDQLELLVSELKTSHQLSLTSVFSHLAASEEESFDSFSLEQIDRFSRFCDELKVKLNTNFLRHICNSSAISRFPEAHFEMVRLGIGLYGIDPSSSLSSLKPVSTLKTVISQVKRVLAGSSVGYGRAFIAKNDMNIAILPIGYADGYRRSLGKGVGKVMIKNKLCPTIGNVCMDMTMVDLLDLEVNPGDEVIIMGSNPSVNELAHWMDTIPYEVITAIPPRVKRVYIQE